MTRRHTRRPHAVPAHARQRLATPHAARRLAHDIEQDVKDELTRWQRTVHYGRHFAATIAEALTVELCVLIALRCAQLGGAFVLVEIFRR